MAGHEFGSFDLSAKTLAVATNDIYASLPKLWDIPGKVILGASGDFFKVIHGSLKTPSRC